jgi:DNA-binding CsgD family transcriptional regulator
MGRPRAELDNEDVLDLLQQGLPQKIIAEELGVSIPTLAKKIADIQTKQGLILKYRAIQSLQLTELQAKVLEAVTPEKIDEAPLRDLICAYKILKDKELVVEGQPTEIRGLVAYLVELEKRNLVLEDPIDLDDYDEYKEGSTLQ